MNDAEQAIRQKVRELREAIDSGDEQAALNVGLDLLADFLIAVEDARGHLAALRLANTPRGR